MVVCGINTRKRAKEHDPKVHYLRAMGGGGGLGVVYRWWYEWGGHSVWRVEFMYIKCVHMG